MAGSGTKKRKSTTTDPMQLQQQQQQMEEEFAEETEEYDDSAPVTQGEMRQIMSSYIGEYFSERVGTRLQTIKKLEQNYRLMDADVKGMQLSLENVPQALEVCKQLKEQVDELSEQVQTLTQENSLVLRDQSICLRERLPPVLVQYALRVLKVKEESALPLNFNLSEKEILEHPDVWIIGLIMGEFTAVDFAENDSPGVVTRVTYIRRALRKLLPADLETHGTPGNSVATKWIGEVCQKMAMILFLLKERKLTKQSVDQSVTVEQLLTFRAKHDATFVAAEACIKEVTEAAQDYVVGEGFSHLKSRNITAYSGNLTSAETSATTQALRQTTVPEEEDSEKIALHELIKNLRRDHQSLKQKMYSLPRGKNRGGNPPAQLAGGKRDNQPSAGGGAPPKKRRRK